MRRLVPMLAVGSAALLSAACRDALEPWTPPVGVVDSAAAVRITYNPGDDVSPAWLGTGDSIMYAAEAWEGLPPGHGLLLAVQRHGGTANLLFPGIQSIGASGPRWLIGPAASPDGTRIAYTDVASVAPSVQAPGCAIAEPVLDSVVVRVRPRNANGSVFDDPSLGIAVAGRDPAIRTGQPGPYRMRLHPFQRAMLDDRLVVTSASWSPDGQRLVVSDGLRLRTWNLSSSPVDIGGTSDGVSPAWSPDGEWIAFARLERGDSSTTTCSYTVGRNVEQQVRTGYTGRRSFITIVHPDGTGTRQLAEGRDPAWSPDSRFVYFAHDGMIRRMEPNGGTATVVPDTEAGRMPAASPDGGRMAFVRGSTLIPYDIWTVPLSR